MKENLIEKTLKSQKAFFNSGSTLAVEVRKSFLKKLRESIKNNQESIAEALYKDLGANAFECYMTETGLLLDEIRYMLRHLRCFSRHRSAYTPLAQQPGRTCILPQPLGTVLIISPWNYPFLLSLEPLIDALAAGNTAVLKLSPYSPNSNSVIMKIVEEVFPEEYVSVFTGHRDVTQELLHQPFDFIFYTGSTGVGKEVMKAASDNLIPVALELGGKSPCIVDSTANLKVAARRTVFGKFLNSGQTCVAPDYILVEKSVHNELIRYLQEEIVRQYSKNPLQNPTYGKIVNGAQFKRLVGLLQEDKIVYGGTYDESTLQIEPTIMDNVTPDDPVMHEEIFGPILPVLTFSDFEDVIIGLQKKPSPLALYIFTENRDHILSVEENLKFGGGCVNDTVIQLATSHTGFGGIGNSGMGSYHGKAGFDCFTHFKPVLRRSALFENPIRYRPHNGLKESLLKLFLK